MTDTMPGDDNVSGSVGDQTTAKNAGVISTQTREINSDLRANEGNGEVTPVERAELCASKRHARADAKMASRAARNGWPVPQALRAKVVERLDGLLDSGDDRTTIAAARAVVEINKQNLEIDMAEDKNQRLDEGKATERVETPIKFIRGTDGEGV